MERGGVASSAKSLGIPNALSVDTWGNLSQSMARTHAQCYEERVLNVMELEIRGTVGQRGAVCEVPEASREVTAVIGKNK